MGFIAHLSKLWQKNGMPKELKRERLISWRREPATTRVERPTRPDRARALGYRAKHGIFIVRQRVSKGGHVRTRPNKGRRSRNMSIHIDLRKNYRQIAEERASKKHPNCEVLNSYYVLEDGKHQWFEVIMVDRAHPQTRKDHRTSWIAGQRGRAQRGLTSAGRKGRGLRKKGKGAEKARPSRRAHARRQ